MKTYDPVVWVSVASTFLAPIQTPATTTDEVISYVTSVFGVDRNVGLLSTKIDTWTGSPIVAEMSARFVPAGSLQTTWSGSRANDSDEGWEVALMTRLDALAELQPGWAGRGSQPMNAGAAQHFRDFLPSVTRSRAADAHPILTDDGSVRLEWHARGHHYSAEIGEDSLYLCDLAPDAASDADVELAHFDAQRLLAFFRDGALGE